MAQTMGFTVWLTGMRGAGKTTLARYLGQRFAAIGRRAEVLDHEELADVLFKGLGPTKEERELAVRRLGYLAKLLTRNDTVVLVASLSPCRESRDAIRREVNRFVEVFVDCPTEKLIERDTTGQYKKALAGELPNFTGITDPYETPQHAEVTLKTDAESVEESAQRVFQALVSIGYLSPADASDMAGKRVRALPKAKAGKAGKAPKAGKAKPAAKPVPAKAASRKPAPQSKAAKGKPAKPAKREPAKKAKKGGKR